MFPWHLTFLWAPHLPASGDVTLSGWTNSLISVRDVIAVQYLRDTINELLNQGPRAKQLVHTFDAGPSSPEHGKLREELAVVESLLERLKVHP